RQFLQRSTRVPNSKLEIRHKTLMTKIQNSRLFDLQNRAFTDQENVLNIKYLAFEFVSNLDIRYQYLFFDEKA
ncbi:MAG: hypothetical protein ACE5NG_12480, partial [bacterium]